MRGCPRRGQVDAVAIPLPLECAVLSPGPVWQFRVSEGLYQAAKCPARPDIQQRTAEVPTAGDAAAIGRTPGLGIHPGRSTFRLRGKDRERPLTGLPDASAAFVAQVPRVRDLRLRPNRLGTEGRKCLGPGRVIGDDLVETGCLEDLAHLIRHRAEREPSIPVH